MDADKLAEFANSIIDTSGISYSFGINSKICDLVDKEFDKSKNRKLDQLFLNGDFIPQEGDKTTLKFPIGRDSKNPCGECSINLPLASATETYFMLILQKQLINFRVPTEFNYKKVSLVDNRNLSAVKNTWVIPFQTTPIAVSADGTILYTNLSYKDLDELAYQIFSNGIIQFTSKEKLDLKEETKYLENAPKDSIDNNLTYLSFGKGEQQRIIKFSAPCKK